MVVICCSLMGPKNGAFHWNNNKVVFNGLLVPGQKILLVTDTWKFSLMTQLWYWYNRFLWRFQQIYIDIRIFFFFTNDIKGKNGTLNWCRYTDNLDISVLHYIHIHTSSIPHNITFQEKFGADIQIVDNKKTVPTKRYSEYGSSVDTDDLANDSDLDVSTCK